MATEHHVRSWKHLFESMSDGRKTHDLRKNDRKYAVGDVLVLQEYDPALGSLTGRTCPMLITYITGRDEGHNPCALSSSVLPPDHVILSVRKL